MKLIILAVGKAKGKLLKRILSWTAVVLYMAVIFTLSGQQGFQSNRMSNKVIDEVENHMSLPSKIQYYQKTYTIDYNYILRKTTHFVEYFILAILFYMAFACCGISLLGCVFVAFPLCVFYACLDEYHQWFTLGRTSRIGDVFIDSSGALFALALVYLYKKVYRRQKVV